MPRPPRNEFPFATWHVTSRGVEKRNIFLGNRDRKEFIDLLGRLVRKHQWHLYAYVLMSNHYHLLLMTPEPNLAEGMQELGGLYAQYFNRKYARWGHLFGGRFKSHLVESGEYLLAAARYIVLNPVRSGLTMTAAEWPWSSYAATAGLTSKPRWLASDFILQQICPADRGTAVDHYREYVAAATIETNAGVTPGSDPSTERRGV